MRRRTAMGWSLLIVAIVLAACTGQTSETTTTTVATTTTTTAPTTTTTSTTVPAITRPYGGEAVIIESQEPPTLNAFLPGGDTLIVSIIGQTYAAGVQEIDGNTLDLIPELVTELPTVENGGVVLNVDGTMTVKYQIVDDARWSDGTPLTGEDFQFTLETILDPDLPISKLVYEDIFTSTAEDKTFEYTMAAPTLQHELLFSEILPKHAVEGSDFVVDWNDARWPSAGPFVLSEWERGDSLTVVRNGEYWKTDPESGQQLPYLDSVTFRFITDAATAQEAFTVRDGDIITPEATVPVVESLRALESDGAAVEVVSGPTWEHLNFQFGPGRLNRNPSSCTDRYEMRLAVAQTIDRDRIVDEVLGGLVEPLDSYVDAFTPSLSLDAWAAYVADSEAASANYQAASELAGAPCTVVFTTTSTLDERVQMAELFVGMFEEAGIPFENQLEANQLFFGDTLSTGRWDVGSWAWVGSPGFSGLVNIHDVFDPEGSLPAGSNYYRWGTPDSSVIDDATERFAEVRDEMNSTVDNRELAALVNEAETILAESLVIIPLYARPSAAAVWADEIAGFKHNASVAGYTWNIESWYRADLDLP